MRNFEAQNAEPVITLPSIREQINVSAWLSFMKLFLESWNLGIPYDQVLFPASLFSAFPLPFSLSL